MQRNVPPTKSHTKKPWSRWGCPTELLLDNDWSLQSPAFRQALTELANGGARERDPQS